MLPNGKYLKTNILFQTVIPNIRLNNGLLEGNDLISSSLISQFSMENNYYPLIFIALKSNQSTQSQHGVLGKPTNQINFVIKLIFYIMFFMRPQIYVQLQYKSPNSKSLKALKSISSMHKMITLFFFSPAVLLKLQSLPIRTYQGWEVCSSCHSKLLLFFFFFLQCTIYANIRFHNP